MVAERQQITSLRKPPPGWEFPSQTREARRGWLSRRGGATGEKHWQGPRLDAQSTSELPTLTLGLSTPPTSCQHCAGQFLSTEPPLGEHQRGMVTCSTCGHQVCWLASPTTTRSSHRSTVVMPSIDAVRSPERDPTMRRVISGRFNREAGCGRACSIAYGHDASSHEAYGRQQALAEVMGKPRGVVRTGPLVVDFDRDIVTVAGVDPILSRIEHKVVLYLAERIGRVCRHEDLVEAVWGWGQVHARSTGRHDRTHILRVHKTRVCQKLGPAGRLIQTYPGRGYMLSYEPPTGGDS